MKTDVEPYTMIVGTTFLEKDIYKEEGIVSPFD